MTTFPASGWAVHQADAIEFLQGLPAGSVDAIITDPPYGIAYKSKQFPKGIKNDDQPFIWFLHEAYRVTKDGGSIVCFCRWDVQEAFRLALKWAGWHLRSQIVWDREHHGMGDLKAGFAPRHDVAWFATKDERARFRFPAHRPHSVIRAKRVAAADLTHPNEKPIPLCRELVEALTRPGDLVVDTFVGSGAFGEAAVTTGRRFVGVDIDEHFADVSRKRLAALPPTKPTLPLLAA